MIDFQGSRCETCKFAFQEGDELFCRRFPPTPVTMISKVPTTPGEVPEYNILSRFPTMLPSGWCGEYLMAHK